MSDKYVPGSSVCEHGRLRRQCSDCEVTELYKEIGEKDALIESQAKEIEEQKRLLLLAIEQQEETIKRLAEINKQLNLMSGGEN